MKRLFESGIITTIIGLLFMGVALYSYLFRGVSHTEVGAITAIGFIFLRSKDSLIGLGKK